MARFGFLDLARKILEEEKKALTSSEIWDIAKAKGYDKQINSQGLTPWNTISARIYTDIKNNPSSIFEQIGIRPTRFAIKSLGLPIDANIEIDNIEEKEDEEKILEKALHKFLNYYGRNYMNIYLKTIEHTKSKKSDKYMEWMHPDMVGCYFPHLNLSQEVYNLNKEIGNIPIKLFSFEIKRFLNFSNLRKSFFQAVSNSSWANESYLVAADIDRTGEFENELKRLSTSFGIGIIQLNRNDPDSSKILFSAKQKDELDWETIEKIAKSNPDFKEFITRIAIDINSKEKENERLELLFDKLYDSEFLGKNFDKVIE